MQRPSGSRAPAKTPAGQNNNALLNSWERQPVWKVELYARYKCWRAFHPDSRSCLRPLSQAAKREQDRFGDSSWTHRPHPGSVGQNASYAGLWMHDESMNIPLCCLHSNLLYEPRIQTKYVQHTPLNLHNKMFYESCTWAYVNTNKVCMLKNKFHPIVSSTRRTGDDAMSVKQGFQLEDQNILYFFV